MRVACPSCAAAYEVPDALLTADRTVRCARCGENWKPMAPVAGQRDGGHERDSLSATNQSAPAPAPARAPAPALARAGSTAAGPFLNDGSRAATALPSRGAHPVSAMERLAALAKHPRDPDMALTAAWAASVVLLVLILAATLVWRDEIAHVWPATGRLYAWVGLPVTSTAPPQTLRAAGGQAAPDTGQNSSKSR